MPSSQGSLLSRLRAVDWDFAEDRCASKFSSVHWHPCRYIAQVPATLLGLMTEPGDKVLDPFCGSGTTLVEAQRLGRKGIGIELNPIAVLLCRSKLLPIRAERIVRGIHRLEPEVAKEVDYLNGADKLAGSDVPPSVQLNKWYSPETGVQLARLWKFVRMSRSRYVSILHSAFSAILLQVCNETRHWGYVCDNSRPKQVRRIDALKAFIDALRKYADAYLERDLYVSKGVRFPLPASQVIRGDAIHELSRLPTASVDAVITSPPYFGVCDYIKAQRLSMEWFGIEIDPLRRLEIGARSKRHRITAREEYISDLILCFQHIFRVLRPGKCMALVVGESSARTGVYEDIRAAVQHAGFRVLTEMERVITERRRQHPSVNDEQIIIASKPLAS